MFREMRRKGQLLNDADVARILDEGKSGVLALAGDGGYPYAVPLSYVYDDGRIFFHGAKSGHKVDSVRRCPKASFCIVAADDVVPKEYTTYFKSVIVFGKIRIIEDSEEAMGAVLKLATKYNPSDSEQGRKEAVMKEWRQLCMMELTVEHMTGKAARELI